LENFHHRTLQFALSAGTEIMDLNQAEQQRLEIMMQKKQQKEFMKMFFRVTADCFDTCITDFSSKALSAREVLPSLCLVLTM
jgi:hypothetical protein